jgi:SAM-dependent methyltransferase
LVIDLGCGSGIWDAKLVRAGYRVLGIDSSVHMIRLAKKRAPKARFRTASYMNTRLPKCAAVTALGECFNYSSRPNGDNVAEFFKRVHKSLLPGGLFIFDIATPKRKVATVDHWEGNDWAILLRGERTSTTLTRRMVVYRKIGKQYRRSEEVHVLRLYRPTEIARWLRSAGFEIKILKSYRDFHFPNGLVVFVARKQVRGSTQNQQLKSR